MTDFIDEAVAEANIILKSEKTGADIYRCTLSSDYCQMTRDITVKTGVTAPPDIGNLLYYFAQIAQSVRSTDDFEDWAEETGHDTADKDAKSRYKQQCKDTQELRTLLGGYCFDNLLQALAIHQAISNAIQR